MSDLTTSFNGLSIDPAKYRRIANATGACNIIERIDGNDINTGNAAIERKDEALLWIYLAAVDKGVKEELLGKATERATFLKNLVDAAGILPEVVTAVLLMKERPADVCTFEAKAIFPKTVYPGMGVAFKLVGTGNIARIASIQANLNGAPTATVSSSGNVTIVLE